MAISVVQRASGFGSAGNVVVAFGSAITAGNTIIVVGVRDSGTFPATLPTDTLANTYVSLDTQNGSGIAYRAFAVHSASGGANSVTYPTGSFALSVLIFEVAGLASTNFFDAASVISATLTSSGVTTVDANELLLAIYLDNGNVLPTMGLGAGYSNLLGPVNNAFSFIASEERIVSSTGTYTASFTSSGGNGNTYTILLAFGDTSIAHPPTVTTQAESSISDVSATGNGNITSLGGGTPDHQGVVYSTSTQSLPGNVAPGSSGYSGDVDAAGSFSTGAFTSSMTGLSANTTYFVRAYAHNSAGYAYGGEVSFTTLTGLPTVTTQATTVTGETTATGNGNLTVAGTSTTTVEGVVWSTSTQSLPGNVAPGSSGYSGEAHSSGSFGTGAFTQNVTGLTKNTTYFMRAYVQDTAGYSYGGEVSFTTNPGTPLIDDFSDNEKGFVDDTTSAADDKLLLESGFNLLLEDGVSKLILNYSYPVTNYVSYTVPSTETLSSATTYYWRVRQKSNNGVYGPWSSTQSFTTASSGVVSASAGLTNLESTTLSTSAGNTKLYLPQVLPHQVDLQGGFWNLSSGTSNSFAPGVWHYTAANYTGQLEVFMEGIDAISSTSGTISFSLYDVTAGAQVGTNLKTLTTAQNVLTLWRDTFDYGPLLTDGHDYRIQAFGDVSGTTSSAMASRLIILQHTLGGSIAATETWIPMTDGLGGATNTTLADMPDSSYFLYEAAKWDGTATPYLEFQGQAGQALPQVNVQLFDITAGSLVSGASATNVAGTAQTRARSGSFTLTDGHQYKVQTQVIANTQVSPTYWVYGVNIVMVQTGTITKYQSHHALNSQHDSTTASASLRTGKNFFKYPDFTANDTIANAWYEATIKTSNASTSVTSNAWDSTASAYLSAGIATTSTSYARVRSTTFTPSATATNNTDQLVISSNGTDTITVAAMARLIYDMNFGSTTATVASAGLTNLEATTLATSAVLTNLEAVPVATNAVNATLEGVPVATSAGLTNVEPTALSTTAGLTAVEPTKLATSAVLTILEATNIVSTTAALTTLELTVLATSAGLTNLEASNILSTSAGLNTLESTTLVTSAGLTNVEPTKLATAAGLTNFEPTTLSTTAGNATLEEVAVLSTTAGLTNVEPTVVVTSAGLTNVEPTTLSTTAGLTNVEPTTLSNSAGLTTFEKANVLATAAGLTNLEAPAVATSAGLTNIEPTNLSTTAGLTILEATNIVTTTAGLTNLSAPTANISTFEEHKNFISDEVQTTSTTMQEMNSGTTFYRGIFDPTQFDNITAIYFEAVMKVASGFTATAKLYNVTDSVDLSSTVSTTSTTWSRQRIAIGTIPTTTKELAVYFNTSTTGQTAVIAAGRLIIQQGSNATMKETEILMSSSYASTSTSLIESPFNLRWLYQAAKYDGVTGVYLDAYMSNATSATSTVTLRDLSTSTDVATLTHVGISNARHRSADFSGSLTDGHEYAVFISTTSGGTADYGIVRLIIAQANFTKTQYIMNPDTGGINATKTGNGAFYFDPAVYGVYSKTFNVELTASNSSSSVTVSGASTDGSGVTDSGGSITTLTGSTAIQRIRSSSPIATPSSAREYRWNSSSATWGEAQGFRIITDFISTGPSLSTSAGTANLESTTLSTSAGNATIEAANIVATSAGQTTLEATNILSTSAGQTTLEFPATFSTTAGLANLEESNVLSTSAGLTIFETAPILATSGGLTTLEATLFGTSAGNATLESTTLATTAGLTTLEKTNVVATSAGITSLEAVVVATSAGLTNVEPTSLSTSAGLTNVEPTTLATSAGIAPLEAVKLATSAGITTFEIANVVSTTAATTTLEGVPVATSAATTSLEATNIVATSAGLTTLELTNVVATSAGNTTLELTVVTTSSGNSTLESTSRATSAGITGLESVTLATSAGITSVEPTNLATSAGLTTLETAPVVATSAGNATLDATVLATSAGTTNFEPTVLSTSAGLTNMEGGNVVDTTAGTTTLEATNIISATAGLTTFEVANVLSTTAGTANLEPTKVATAAGLTNLESTTLVTSAGNATLETTAFGTSAGNSTLEITKFGTNAGLTTFELANVIATSAGSTTLEETNILSTTAGITVFETAAKFSTAAGLTTLEAPAIATTAGQTTLESTVLVTSAGITTLETSAKFSTTAGTVLLEATNILSTSAGRTDVEPTSLSNSAGTANLEPTKLSNSAGLTTFEVQPLSTSAGSTTLEATSRATSAGMADLQNQGIATSAGMADFLAVHVATSAGFADLELSHVTISAGFTLLVYPSPDTVIVGNSSENSINANDSSDSIKQTAISTDILANASVGEINSNSGF